MPVVAFDLNGTLLDPSALAEPLGGTDDDRALVLGALDDAIAQAMAATLAGAFPAFPDLLRAGLERRLELAGRDPASAADAVGRTAAMRPYGEVPQALDVLRDAGFDLAVVTNSATASAEGTLSRAGIRERFATVLGVDAVGAYKPDARVYRELVRRLEVPAGDVWLVAAHFWDVLGAKELGLHTGWVARKERLLLAPLGAPDVRGDDVLQVAEAIAATAGPG